MHSSNHPREDFSALRKLLVLKRYEVPPPGYFQRFADRVITRIEAGSAEPALSWWRQFLEGFVAKPALALAYGLCAVSLGFLGFRVAATLETPRATVAVSDLWPETLPLALVTRPPSPAAVVPAEFVSHEENASSVSPLLQRPTSLFHPVLGTEDVRMVNYTYPSR
jgi:hypothetical protein